MVRTTIASILLVLSLVVGGFVHPVTTHAQNAQNNSLDNTGAINDTNGQATTGTTTDRGFNWLWLLPLLAIPVLYFVMRDTRDTTTSNEGYLAGTKGGRVTRSDDEAETDETEEDAIV